MLTFQVETYDGGCYQLPMLLRWDLELTGGVPCDSLSVTCLYDKGMAGVLPRATRFTAAWGGETMLRGVVDAYEISMSACWPPWRAEGWRRSCWTTSRRP